MIIGAGTPAPEPQPDARMARLEAFADDMRALAAVGTPSITKTAVRAALAKLEDT